MKAIVCRTHGRPDVLRLEEIDRPSVPDDGLLVRVHASSINPVDFFPLSRVAYTARLLSGGLKSKAKVLGIDFAGTVESVGQGVTDFRPGDEVFGGANGAFAEYVSLPSKKAVVRKPANLTHEEAAALPAEALTAWQALITQGRLKPGDRVLIHAGAGGVETPHRASRGSTAGQGLEPR